MPRYVSGLCLLLCVSLLAAGAWWRQAAMAQEETQAAQAPAAGDPFTDPAPAPAPNDDNPFGDATKTRSVEKASPPAEAQAVPAGSLEEVLAKTGDWSFVDTPLKEVAAKLRDATGVDIVLDTMALEDVGIGSDTPISMEVRGISLRSFLRLALHELDLTFDQHDGALWITTWEQAESRLSVQAYPVSDLIRVSDAPGEQAFDYDSLAQLVSSTIAPDTWDYVGGPGAVQGIYGALVVSQTLDIHEQLHDFFAAYRAVARQHQADPAAAGSPVFLGMQGRDRIRAALDSRLSLEATDEPLIEVIHRISTEVGIPIVTDVRSLEDYGIGSDTPVSIRVSDLPLRSILRRTLRDLGLTWVIDHEVLVITTEESGEAMLETCFYPVGDLVAVSDPLDGVGHDFDSLIQVISSTVAPDTWDEVGGPGAIEVTVHPPALVISQTEGVHEEVLGLLAKLRSVKAAERTEAAAAAARPASQEMTIRTYTVAIDDPDKLVDLVTRLVGTDVFRQEGAMIDTLGFSLVIRHTEQVHLQVQRALIQLQAWQDNSGGGFGAPGGGFGTPRGGGFGQGMPGGMF